MVGGKEGKRRGGRKKRKPTTKFPRICPRPFHPEPAIFMSFHQIDIFDLEIKLFYSFVENRSLSNEINA